MIYKIADSYLTNTNPFRNADGTRNIELRKSPNYSTGIKGTFNGTSVINSDLVILAFGENNSWQNTYAIKNVLVENGKLIIMKKNLTSDMLMVDFEGNEIPNGYYTSENVTYTETVIYPDGAIESVGTNLLVTDDCYIVDFLDSTAGTITLFDGEYQFDIKEDGYYSLFGFDNKVKNVELISGRTVITFEAGNIQQETSFTESYIDIKQTGSPKIFKTLVSWNAGTATFTSNIFQNDLDDNIVVRYADSTITIKEANDSPIFTENKTFVYPTINYYFGDDHILLINTVTSVDTISFAEVSTSYEASNYNFTNLPITIEVYP